MERRQRGQTGASLTGRRECIEDSYSGVMCAVCGRSPAAVPGAGPARRLQPFHSCVLAFRNTLPQAQPSAFSPSRPAARRTGRTRDERRDRISKQLTMEMELFNKDLRRVLSPFINRRRWRSPLQKTP
jgi:hypothetical protein